MKKIQTSRLLSFIPFFYVPTYLVLKYVEIITVENFSRWYRCRMYKVLMFTFTRMFIDVNSCQIPYSFGIDLKKIIDVVTLWQAVMELSIENSFASCRISRTRIPSNENRYVDRRYDLFIWHHRVQTPIYFVSIRLCFDSFRKFLAWGPSFFMELCMWNSTLKKLGKTKHHALSFLRWWWRRVGAMKRKKIRKQLVIIY